MAEILISIVGGGVIVGLIVWWAIEDRRIVWMYKEAERKNRENEDYDGTGPPPPHYVVR